MSTTRRQILTSAGAAALVTSLGADYALGLGLTRGLRRGFGGALRGDDVDLGDYTALADLFESVAPDELLPRLVRELRGGTSLARLVAAGALANARSLGGEDYEGYHAFMGMAPSLAVARELPERDAPLPVLKTLKRSAVRMQRRAGARLRAVEPEACDVRAAVRARELERAERALTAVGDAGAWEALQPVVVDDIEVHLVVFAWRAKEIADLAGAGHAVTAMRQILHFADGREARRRRDGAPAPEVRSVVPRELERAGLEGGALGEQRLEDRALSELADALVDGSQADGAAACATALGKGAAPEDVAEALCLASARLLLRDKGRADDAPGRPRGSVHGASVGVHASDSALAWRGIAASLSGRARAAALVTGGFHTAGQGHWIGRADYPFAAEAEAVRALARGDLAPALAEACRGGDQPRAGALAQRMAELDLGEELFTTLRPISVAQDGALHAEKYQHTSRVVHGFCRPAFRAQHLVAYARVVASQACAAAPEVAEARELLG